MKRLFALLVAVLLPLQFAWGVAAAYCQHDADAKQHFGHHAHVHVEQGKAQEPNKASGGIQADLDCGFCHAGSAAALPAFDAAPAVMSVAAPPLSLGDPRPPSAPQRTPDRPQWLRLA
ncbi:cation efflux protein, CzcI family [Pelomonas sp. KK5]|uniref:cation efflux protein, CzcI family n=1 Tax=Pelomonas sp. KK5 TaxID=1855730 RepID=UPI00097C9734|nr:cation efflux protein, CzcI family [Pelomonas sp. KK5]